MLTNTKRYINRLKKNKKKFYVCGYIVEKRELSKRSL